MNKIGPLKACWVLLFSLVVGLPAQQMAEPAADDLTPLRSDDERKAFSTNRAVVAVLP